LFLLELWQHCTALTHFARGQMAQSSNWYDAHAADLAQRYEGVEPAKLYDWLSGLRSEVLGTVLDVGAGSGRDAAWFAAQGHDVVAVEPSSSMRSEGEHRHPDPRIRWLDDELPDLNHTGQLGISFDLVLLSAVWQHVAPTHRERAFRKLAGLVKSGGLLAISLRSGPSPPESRMYAVSLDEVERLARNHGFSVEKIIHQAVDQQGRADISWTCVALRQIPPPLPFLSSDLQHGGHRRRAACKHVAITQTDFVASRYD
jgi:SAM-dependent methyltransferase